MPESQRGGDVLLGSLVAHGVRHIFGNPGTTENPLMDRLVDFPQLTYVLNLHEGVALGAASYYAQSSGRTGIVNVHVGPGLGNALGMLYNAWEANSPMIVTAGQQDTRSRLAEPLLGHDLVAMAAPLVKWSVQAERADEVGPILRRAFKVAHDGPPGPVFVSLPVDVLESETQVGPSTAGRLFRATPPDAAALAQTVEMLSAAKRPAIIVGDGVATAGAVDSLVKVAEHVGAPVYFEGLVQRMNFPNQHASARLRMPLHHAGIRRVLDDTDLVLLVGGSFFEELWFDPDSPFPEGASVVQIESSVAKLGLNFPLDVGILGDVKLTLDAIVEGLGEASDVGAVEDRRRALRQGKEAEAEHFEKRLSVESEAGVMTPATFLAALADAVGQDCHLVNEAITAGTDLLSAFDVAGPDRYQGTRGGGIGQALPGAIGVSHAHPGERVVAISGDGSSMYSIQALWTAAHDHLPILFVILHNREYKVLKINLDIYRQRFGVDADKPYPHMDLTQPELDFVRIAEGLGVPALRIDDASQVSAAVERALSTDGPTLLDVRVLGRVDGSEPENR